MEVLSLALLGAASAGFLATANKQKQEKKENFTTVQLGDSNALFSDTLKNNTKMNDLKKNIFPEANENGGGAYTFNPLGPLFHPARMNFKENPATGYPEFTRPDDGVIQNMFQTLFSKPSNVDGTQYDISMEDTVSQTSKYRLPKPSGIAELADKCESANVNKDGEPYHQAKCDIFTDTSDEAIAFRQNCGICHDSQGLSNASGKPKSASLGLYSSSRIKALSSETINDLNYNGPSYNIRPTLGSCGSDPKTKFSYFSLDKESCIATNKFQKCKKGGMFQAEGCYECQDGSSNYPFFFIDRYKNGIKNLARQAPTRFQIWGNGNVSIQIDDLTGPNYLTTTKATSNFFDATGSSSTDISASVNTLSSTETIIQLQNSPPAEDTTTAPVTDTKYIVMPPLTNPYVKDTYSTDTNYQKGQPADGFTLTIKLSGGTRENPPFLCGRFFGRYRDEGGTIRNKYIDFADFVKDVTRTTEENPLIFGENNQYSRIFPPRKLGAEAADFELNATFKLIIPYMFLEIRTDRSQSILGNRDPVQNYCTTGGYYVRSQKVAEYINRNPCYRRGHGPGNYSQECLQNIFIAAGCKQEGAGYPNTPQKADFLNKLGLIRPTDSLPPNSQRTLGAIGNYIVDRYDKAWSGLKGPKVNGKNTTQMTAREWLAERQFCFNKDAVNTNPCDDLSDAVKASGTLSDECIKYIFTDGAPTVYGGTYTLEEFRNFNSAPNLSMKKPNTSGMFTPLIPIKENFKSYNTYENKDASSLFSDKKNDSYCQKDGKMSPIIGNSEIQRNAMETARSLKGIEAVKQFYRNMHNKSNEQGMKNSDRAQFVSQCYGKDLSIQSDADPAREKGMDVAKTNCGVKGRYVRLWGNNKGDPNGYLQISQLVVIDARGENVARGKRTSSSSVYENSTRVFGPQTAVDGNYKNKVWSGYTDTKPDNFFFHSATGNNEWWEVDLGGIYDIVQIIYYNRGDCCKQRAQDMEMYLYADGVSNRLREQENNPTYNSRSIVWMAKTGKGDYFTDGDVQYFSLATSTAANCPNVSSYQRGDLFTQNQPININMQSRINSLGKYPVFNLESYPGVKGGDLGNSKFIWNEPYADKRANTSSSGVTFYTILDNNLKKTLKYEFKYRVDDEITNLKMNNATLKIPPKGTARAWVSADNVGSVSVWVLPGKNLFEITVANTGDGPAAFIGVFKDTSTGLLKNATDANNNLWQSSTAPLLGQYSDSQEANTTTIYELNDNIYTNSGSLPSSAKWIWNQPLAGKYGTDVGTVHFFIKVSVSGISVLNYKLVFQVDDRLSVTVNNTTKGEVYASWSQVNGNPDAKEITFQVVPGLNLIQVDCWNGGGQAGFRAVIRDNNGNDVANTWTNTTNWSLTTVSSKGAGDPCAYVPDDATNIPYTCANKIFGEVCGGRSLSTDKYTGGLISMNKGGLRTEFTNNWAAKTASSTNQEDCKGQTVCPSGQTYNSSNDKCESATPSRSWSARGHNIPLAPCSDWTSFCGVVASEQPDGSCFGGRWNICHGSCMTCYGWVKRESIASASKADRLRGSCPPGFSKSSWDIAYCVEDVPSNVEQYGNAYRYKCEPGEYRRSSDQACIAVQNPRF